eukprot:TRINITY_DN23340_c0_g1_i1.p1 TRINITY_DN23340_c0_g1~~TRINITY_DN23340_c0_g1_i1.p1  ORF type:complete len:302 (+),score=30.17 TRINITY_DN23340_c0_g1_i1:82-987(+)
MARAASPAAASASPSPSRRVSGAASVPSLVDEDDCAHTGWPATQWCAKHSRERLLRYLCEVRPGEFECVRGSECKQPRLPADARQTNLFKGQHFACQECEIVLNSWAQLQVHLGGSRHTKRIKELRLSKPRDWEPRPPIAIPVAGHGDAGPSHSHAAAAALPAYAAGAALPVQDAPGMQPFHPMSAAARGDTAPGGAAAAATRPDPGRPQPVAPGVLMPTVVVPRGAAMQPAVQPIVHPVVQPVVQPVLLQQQQVVQPYLMQPVMHVPMMTPPQVVQVPGQILMPQAVSLPTVVATSVAMQ